MNLGIERDVTPITAAVEPAWCDVPMLSGRWSAPPRGPRLLIQGGRLSVARGTAPPPPSQEVAVYLDVEQGRRLRALANRERRAQAELVREAIDRYLAWSEEPVLPSWVGMVSTDRLDSTEARRYRQDRIDDVLRGTGGG